MNSFDKSFDLAATLPDPRWAALQARDARADGSFFYSVRTTGIYFRTPCGACRARPQNVAFHATAAAAERADFRPCKRCQPDQDPPMTQHAAMVTAACRVIEQAETTSTLGLLARSSGLSPFHFHRVFKAVAGVTPKQYAMAHRSSRVREQLTRSTSVTEAIYDAGYYVAFASTNRLSRCLA